MLQQGIDSISRRVVAAMLFACGIATQVQAQTGSFKRTDSVGTHLGELVVTATRAQTTLNDMSLHTTIISRAELAKSPAQTVDQLLRSVPGMNLPGAPFYTTDPTGHQTKLRGVSNSKVLMLLDGVPIHDPFFSTTQWFKVPLSSIERLEVVRGGASSTWGNLAVAGVVNIITRKPTDNSGQADVSYQSMGTLNAAIAKNFVVGHGFSLRFSGDILDTDGYQTTPSEFLATVPGKGASSATNTNLRLAGYYSPNSNFDGFFRLGYHKQDQVIGGYEFGNNIQKGPDGAAGFTHRFGGTSRVDVKAWAQKVSFDKQNGAGCYLLNATTCNTTSTSSPLVQYANSEDVNPYRELGGSAMVSSVFSGLPANMQLGVDFRRISGEDSATTYNRPTATSKASATINRTNYGQGTQQFLGGFGQFSVYPTSKLQATVALRYDHWTNRDGVARMTKFTNGVPAAPLGGALADGSKGSFNPSITARYQFSDNVAVRAAAYRAFRAPGLNNLYRSFSSTTSITIANPTLQPETLTGGEAGIDLRGNAFTVSATGFQYNTKALIASYRITSAATAPPEVIAICGPTLSNCPATVNLNTNGQDAVSRGVELVATWQLAPSLTLDGTYTYTDSHYEQTTTGDPIKVQLGGIPRDVITLGLDFEPTQRWNVYASVRNTGSMYLDVNRTIPQKHFALFSLSTSFRVNEMFQLYGSAVNLGDEVYTDNATTSAASKTLGMPRAVTAGLRVKF
jgi:outer membrane receptor protein involved in Fe transport